MAHTHTPTTPPADRPVQIELNDEGMGSRVTVNGVDISDYVLGINLNVDTYGVDASISFSQRHVNVQTQDPEGTPA